VAHKKALERFICAKTDSNHVPTSIDAYTKEALKEWFVDRDLATSLLLSLNKNHLESLAAHYPRVSVLLGAHKD
jgi:hypothetical protein